MNQYQQTIEDINSILTTDNRQLRYGSLALQNRFDKSIIKLKDYGISGFSSGFLKDIAKDNKLNTRQRINRLLKNSRVLFVQSRCYVKENTTLVKFLYQKYGETLNKDTFRHKEYVYKLIDRFSLRRKEVVFKFNTETSTLK